MYRLFAVLAIVMAIGLIIAAFAKRNRPNDAATASYSLHGSLFTPAERSFLGVLDTAVGKTHRVFGKVRIADVVKIKSANKKSWQSHFNRINAKHFDFIVCDATDMKIVCVVELDDKSHGQRARAQRDEFVALVCAKSGLPFLQIPARPAYTVSDVAAEFNQHVSGTALDKSQPSSRNDALCS